MKTSVLVGVSGALLLLSMLSAAAWHERTNATPWKKGQTIKVCVDTPPGDAAQQTKYKDAVKEALKEWNDAQAEFKGLKLDIADKDCDVKVHWKDKASAWGETTKGGPPVDVTAESDDGINANGVTRILKHEFGHVEGLGHSAESDLMKEDAYSSNPGHAPSAADLNKDPPFTAPTADDKAGKKSMWGQTDKLSKSTAAERTSTEAGLWVYSYTLKARRGPNLRDAVTEFALEVPPATRENDIAITSLPPRWRAQFYSATLSPGGKALDDEPPAPSLLSFRADGPGPGVRPGGSAKFQIRSKLAPMDTRAFTNSPHFDSDQFRLSFPGVTRTGANGQGQPAASSLSTVSEGTVTAVNFTTIDGTTAINPYFVGQVTKISFVNVALQNIPSNSVKSRVEQKPDAVRITLADAANVGGIVVAGTAGTVVLFKKAASPQALASKAAFSPLHGAMKIGNGSVQETLMTAAGAIDVNTAPTSQSVEIAGVPSQIVATRGDAVAIQAANVPPPAAGSDPVEMRNASGKVTAAAVPAWSYNVTVQPVTAMGETVPIMVQIKGLTAHESVTFYLTPQPGQHIEPLTVTVGGAAAATPVPIAQLSSNRLGPQSFDVTATKAP